MKKLVLLLLMLLPISIFAETRVDAIIVFGNSLSDNGNFYKLSKQRSPRAPYYEGRFSNGPVWVEYLSTALEAPLNDYAVGGAKTDSGIFPSLMTQMEDYDKQHATADPNALYVIWGGSNNYLLERTADLTQVDEAISDIKYMITNLSKRGAKLFLVPNLPNLGETPLAKLVDKKENSQKFSENLTDLVKTHNLQLAATLAQLEKQLTITIVQLNIYELLTQAMQDPEKYQLTNASLPCYTGPFRGSDKPYCSDPNQYLFWDKVHPTTRVHAEIAKMAEEALLKQGID